MECEGIGRLRTGWWKRDSELGSWNGLRMFEAREVLGWVEKMVVVVLVADAALHDVAAVVAVVDDVVVAADVVAFVGFVDVVPVAVVVEQQVGSAVVAVVVVVVVEVVVDATAFAPAGFGVVARGEPVGVSVRTQSHKNYSTHFK